MGGGSTINIPKTNYAQQLKQTRKGLRDTAPGFFQLNKKYAGPYTDLNLNTLDRTLFGSRNAPGELALQSRAYSATRASDLSDLLALGPAGYAAYFRANPGLAQSMLNLNNEAANVTAPDSLLNQLRNTAGSQLALGGAMSPEETDAINQATRARFAESGIVNTSPAIGAELLNRDAAQQARLGQRIGYATSVENLANQDRSFLNDVTKTNASIYDPTSVVLGRSPVLGGNVSPLSLMGTLNTQALFNPTQGGDAFNTNVNAQGAATIANANQGSAQTNSLIGAAGSIIGGIALAY